MDEQIELGTLEQDKLPEVHCSSNTNKAWLKDSFMISLVSSLLCFPPLGVLTLIKSRQYRQAKLIQDNEATRTLSRESKHLAFISCLLGTTFVVMVTMVLLLQFLYCQKLADDKKYTWKQEYFFKTLNLTLEDNRT